MKRSFIREILEYTSSDTISFAGGLPDALLFPTIELQRATQTALADNTIWQYSTSHRLRTTQSPHCSDVL